MKSTNVSSWKGSDGTSAAHAFAALVPSLPFQLLTFVLFTVYRAAVFGIYSIFVAQVFGLGRIGRVLGFSYALASLFNGSVPLITDVIVGRLDDNWAFFHWACIVMVPLQLAAMRAVERRSGEKVQL